MRTTIRFRSRLGVILHSLTKSTFVAVANGAFLAESSYSTARRECTRAFFSISGVCLQHDSFGYASSASAFRPEDVRPWRHFGTAESTRLHSIKRNHPPDLGMDGILSTLRGGAAGGPASSTSPPLKKWIGPALSCGLSYALYNLFIKRASSLMDPMLGGVLLQCVAALFGAGLWAVTSLRSNGAGSAMMVSRGGVGWSVAAGIAVGLAEILSFVISSRGVPAMKSIPIVVGGSVWFGTVLAAVWLRERVSLRGWFGVLLISAGIALVGTDPSSSALSH